MFGFEEGFVALDVDVDVGWNMLGDGVDTVGAAGEVGRGELNGPGVLLTEVGHFFGVGGDDDAVELGAGAGGLVDPCKHRAPGDDAKDFTGESCGGEACRNDSEDGGGPLFAREPESSMMEAGCAVAMISFLERVLCRRNPFQHIGGVAQMVRATTHNP